MRSVVLLMQQSIDGLVAGPGGDTRWIFPGISPDLEDFLCRRLESVDTMLMGRTTYDEQAAVWPTMRGRMADAVNGHHKVVFSSSPAPLTWAGSRRADRPARDEIAALRSMPGAEIAVSGGPTLARSLLDAGAIDRVQLTIHPLALGTGMRLFEDPVPLALVSSRRFRSGAVVNIYEVGQR